jgi:hypothetical protein
MEEAEFGSVEDVRVAQVCLSADERVEEPVVPLHPVTTP